MRQASVLLCLCLVLAFGGPLAAQEGTIVIRANEPQHTISPYVYGANYGPLSAIPPTLVDQAAALPLNYLRFPGGRWGDMNNIRTNQIDLLMITADIVGAEVGISVRLEDGTPEQAAELVRYTNIERDYNIQHWSIGNEPNLFVDYTVDDLNTQWRAIAEAMLAVDPDITLIGPDLSQYTGEPAFGPFDPNGADWMRAFLEANGDLVDIVAVHRYPFPTGLSGEPTTIDDLRNDTQRWDQLAPGLRKVIQETTGRDLPIAVTEANSHWSRQIGGEATPDAHYNAVWWADVLGRLIRDDLHMVLYFDLQSSDQRGGWGLLSRFQVRPTYYVYQLYGQFGSQHVPTSGSDNAVTAYAALREDGTLTAIFINLSDENQTRFLQVEGQSVNGAQRILLDATHNAQQIEPLTDPSSVILPPQSVTLFVFDDNQG